MLLAARALTQANGVEQALLGEWALCQPQLAEQSQRAAVSVATKAGAGSAKWRRSRGPWPRPGRRTDSIRRPPRSSAGARSGRTPAPVPS